jgi:hypothetical protein
MQVSDRDRERLRRLVGVEDERAGAEEVSTSSAVDSGGSTA